MHLKVSYEHIKSICGRAPNESEQPETDEAYKTIQFIFSGIIVLCVGAFGFVGNILTCLALRMMSKGMTPFNKLLVTLAIFDMMFICLGGAFITKEALRYVLYVVLTVSYVKDTADTRPNLVELLDTLATALGKPRHRGK